jgi:hypothetical protein
MLKMETVCSSRTLVTPTRLHIITTQKTTNPTGIRLMNGECYAMMNFMFRVLNQGNDGGLDMWERKMGRLLY